MENNASGLIAARVELSVEIGKKPKALTKGARITYSERLDLGDWFLEAYTDYRSELMARKRIKPPFAEKEDFLWPSE